MPEVWHSVQNAHTTSDNVMRDVCDRFLWAENDLYRRNPQALQVFLTLCMTSCCDNMADKIAEEEWA